MPIDIKKNQKSIAIELRSKGLSYSEIRKELAVPLSTLSRWLENVQLVGRHARRLRVRRSTIARENSKRRSLQISLTSQQLELDSSKNIKKISNRELWLLGIMLYWRESMRNSDLHKIRKGIEFTSSDPTLIKLFLRWLQQIGKLKKSEMLFDIILTVQSKKTDGDINQPAQTNSEILSKNNSTMKNTVDENKEGRSASANSYGSNAVGGNIAKGSTAGSNAATDERDAMQIRLRAISYWSRVTHCHKKEFSRIYIIKKRDRSINRIGNATIKKRVRTSHAQFGILRIRVKSSSSLARQLKGWISGIRKVINI